MDKLATTREVLGEHLHQKVKEVVVDDDRFNESRQISKITGILLERSVEDIYQMLTNENVLRRSVKIAAESVKDESSFLLRKDEDEQMISDLAKGGENSRHVSYCEEEMNELVYERVYQLDPNLAPQITGILLELNIETIKDILQNPAMFLLTFEKARNCLKSSGKEKEDEEESDSVKKKEYFSTVIYKQATKMYKKHAPKITGMILEMDAEALARIVKDEHSLDHAIVKAYSVLCDNLSS